MVGTSNLGSWNGHWLVVWNHGILWLSIWIGNGIIIPTDFHSIIFQRGRAKNHQPDGHLHGTAMIIPLNWAYLIFQRDPCQAATWTWICEPSMGFHGWYMTPMCVCVSYLNVSRENLWRDVKVKVTSFLVYLYKLSPHVLWVNDGQ